MAEIEYNIREIAKKLSKELEENFPVDAKVGFKFFPFSNENYFSQALNLLKISKERESGNAVRVAILFGESRFLSMLPELEKHVDLILLADIEPSMHLHTKHLLQCLFHASTPEEFITYYQINNPVKDSIVVEDGKEIIPGINCLTDILTGEQGNADSSLKDFHFLKCTERFNKCKEAAKVLFITNIQIDLMNINQVEKLVSYFMKDMAILTLCNFTNIHDYDDDNMLIKTVPLLLKNSSGCFLMYATGGGMNINITQNLVDYFSLKKTYTFDSEEQDISIDSPFQIDPTRICHSTNVPSPRDTSPKPYMSMLLSNPHIQQGFLGFMKSNVTIAAEAQSKSVELDSEPNAKSTEIPSLRLNFT